jgi:ATP-dependent RNA circularization protein (DNA/RNA ligase family)
MKPTRQPGKNKQALKYKTTSAWCMDVKHQIIYFIFQQKKYSTKCKIENND